MTKGGNDAGPTWREVGKQYGQALEQHALLRLLILIAALAVFVTLGDQSPRSGPPPSTATNIEHSTRLESDGGTHHRAPVSLHRASHGVTLNARTRSHVE